MKGAETPEEIFFGDSDVNDDDSIDKVEFDTYYKEKVNPNPEGSYLDDLFTQSDVDKDSKLTLAEYSAALEQINKDSV